jgi:hypothetical protein
MVDRVLVDCKGSFAKHVILSAAKDLVLAKPESPCAKMRSFAALRMTCVRINLTMY